MWHSSNVRCVLLFIDQVHNHGTTRRGTITRYHLSSHLLASQVLQSPRSTTAYPGGVYPDSDRQSNKTYNHTVSAGLEKCARSRYSQTQQTSCWPYALTGCDNTSLEPGISGGSRSYNRSKPVWYWTLRM